MPDHPLPYPAGPALSRTAPRRRRLPLILAGLAGLALVLALGRALPHGWFSPAPPPPRPAAPAALTVTVTQAATRPLGRAVIGDGSVVPWQELVIGFEAGGLKIVEVAIDDGDRVRAGQVLARLDDAVPASQLAQAEAALAEAVAARDIARADLGRANELARGHDLARQTLEQRDSAARQAEARLLAARARRDEAAARLAQTRVLAPADGVISRRSVLPGAVAQTGQEVARLIRDGRLELDARVPELDLAAVRPGQTARLRHGAQAIEAVVRAVAPTVAGDTRLGIVHLALPADSGLRPGMFAEAEILLPPRAGLTVPQQAVLFRDSGPVVFVLAEGEDRVTLRPVQVGERLPGSVEIVAGLAAGELVVTAGAGFLSDGDRVRLAALR